MDSFTTNYLYEIITKCAQNELHQISLQQVKTAYASIGLKPGSKRKEELIQDIIGYLASILIKQCNGNQIREGFPLFNHNNELFLRNPHVKNLIEACNQQIHITNIQLAQLNYSRLSQAKRIVPPTTGVYKCYCDQTIDPNFLTEQVIKCINPKCGKLLHRFCMKLKQERETYPLFECPDCVLLKCDPLHQVCRILVPPFVVDNRRKDFLIDDATYRDIKTNESLAIEVRAIKLEDKSHEQCWPHNGELVLNQFKYLEFKPLQQNSSLKKRKDEKFVTTEVNCGSNSLLLKYVRGSDPRNPRAEETYIAAVYLVKRLTCEELVKKTKSENKRTLEECKKKIIDDFENSSVDIDKLVYPMTCVFDMQPLKTPAKGSHCKHPNCFSLENFVNVWQKNNQRKWNCPICKLKSYDIIVDSYFEKVMDDLKKSGFGNPSQVEVEIMRNAEFRFVKNEDNSDSEDEQKVEAKPEKQQPEKSMNLIVLDDSDEEGGSKKEKAAAAAAAEGKMSVEESSEKKKGEGHEEAMQVEAPKGAEENKPKDSGKMTVESVGDPKKTANRFSPIQINSTDTTPAKIRDSSEVDLKLLKHGTVPDPKKTPQQQQPQPQQPQPQQPQPQQIKPGQPQVPDHIQQQFQDKQKQQAYQVYTQRQQQQQQERQKFPNPYLPQQMLEFQQQHLQSAQRQNPQDKNQLPQKPVPRPTDPASLLGMASGLPQNAQNAQNAALAKVLGQLKNNPSIPPQALNTLLPYLTNMSAKAKMANPSTRTPYDDLSTFFPAEMQKYNIGIEALLPLMRGMQDMAGYANPLRMNPGALLPQGNDPLAAMGFLGGANRNPGNIHNPPNPNILNQGSFLKDSLTPKHPGVSDGSTVGASPKTPGTQKTMMTEKERHTREYSEGAEKHIEKLIDLAEHRPEIPTYETFKTKKNLEPKKVKETDYQKNKKLVGFIMKQMPLQSKGPSNKRLDDTGIMGTKHVKLNEGANINGGAMETEHPQGMNGKIQGKESDPICLD